MKYQPFTVDTPKERNTNSMVSLHHETSQNMIEMYDILIEV